MRETVSQEPVPGAPGVVGLLGAAGAIGRSIAAALGTRGVAYRVIGRGRASLESAFASSLGAEVRTWDIEDPASIRAALEGVDTAIYLVGVDYWKFDLHPILTERVLQAARAAAVKRFLLIGTVYPFGRPRTDRVAEDHPREPHTHKGEMRKRQEDLVLAAHQPGVFETAIIRLADFYGPGVDKSLLWGAFVAAKRGGQVQLVGPIDRPHEFVFVPDAGVTIAALIAHPDAWGATWNLGGAGVTSQKEFVDEIFRQTGGKPRLVVAGIGILRVVGLFQKTMHELVEMHYLITDPVILEDRRLSDLLGGLQKTPYADGIRQTLAAL